MNFSPNSFFELKDFPFKDIFNGIDNTWEVMPKIESYISNKFKNNTFKGNYKEKNVFIGKGSVIEEGAKIHGPVIIGENCHIGHTAFIRNGSVLGDNIHIGHAVEVKNSIILNNTSVSHFNYLGNSVIGGSVNISGGAMLANLRLDKKNVRIKLQDRYIDTSLEKFGAIVGDESIIGVNSVLNPGTILGKKCLVYPLVSVIGTYPDRSRLK